MRRKYFLFLPILNAVLIFHGHADVVVLVVFLPSHGRMQQSLFSSWSLTQVKTWLKALKCSQ